MNVDPEGNAFISILVGTLIGAAIAFGATIYLDINDDGIILILDGIKMYLFLRLKTLRLLNYQKKKYKRKFIINIGLTSI